LRNFLIGISVLLSRYEQAQKEVKLAIKIIYKQKLEQKFGLIYCANSIKKKSWSSWKYKFWLQKHKWLLEK